MVTAHTQLATTINNMENRCQNLESKLKAAQVYEKMFKLALGIQCAGCKQIILPVQFERHISTCKADFEFTVKDAQLVNVNNERQLQYNIQIKNNQTLYNIVRNHYDIYNLKSNMDHYFNQAIPLHNE